MDAAEDLLAKYKKHPFAKGLLPFQDCMAAVGTTESKVFARQNGKQRWSICDKATGQPVLFSHAAVFAEADDIETGNYVPPDEGIPFGVDPKNVQRRASTRCFYTYILDTFTDLSLYEGQWTLDEYISSIPEFNPRTLPRRAYLSGQDIRFRGRFFMQTPMFLRKGAQQEPSDNSVHLHPWVIDADKQSKGYRGNPDRPRVWLKAGDDIVPISERESGGLQRGDILALSFTVTYHITNTYWFAQFHPADIVVLAAGDGDAPDYSAPAIDLHSRPPPSFALGDTADSEMEDSERRVPKKGGVAAGVAVREMEDVVEEGMERKTEVGGDGHLQEQRMDVDESGVPTGRGSSDTMGSSGDAGTRGHEGYELLGSGTGGGEDEDEEFVDIEAQAEEEEGRALRSGGGRAGRPVRRRL